MSACASTTGCARCSSRAWRSKCSSTRLFSRPDEQPARARPEGMAVDRPPGRVRARRRRRCVLDQPGSIVFNGTHFEHLLRNLGVSCLVVAGIFTNSCVEGTIRDAGDRDFRVLMAEDACAAMSQVGHDNAIGDLDKNFCHVKPVDEIVAELEASAARTELLVT